MGFIFIGLQSGAYWWFGLVFGGWNKGSKWWPRSSCLEYQQPIFIGDLVKKYSLGRSQEEEETCPHIILIWALKFLRKK